MATTQQSAIGTNALRRDGPEKLTGRITYSLRLLEELGREVRTLDGNAPWRA